MNLLSFKTRALCFGVAGVCALSGLLLMRPSNVAATPPSSPAPAQLQALQTPPMGTGVDAGTESQSATTATISFATSPPVTAMVFWGKKNIGKITASKPLVIVRPRDSGPLDVIVRTKNYLPVQTRAHTFSDQRVVVKLTPPDKMNELLGYKAPLDAGVAMEQEVALEAMADGGVAAPAATPTFQVVPSAPVQTPLLSP
ncbi:MAG: hypothetical protein QM778_15550 [Myxococcales bacterium]